jgi:hypothetical protein
MRSRLLLISFAAALGACTAMGGLFSAGGTPESGPENGATAASGLETRSLGVYLETMQALVEGDGVLQAEVFENAAEAIVLAPTTTNRLRLALALATPGHAGSNPLEAQRQLSALLAAGDTLLPEERILATIHLQEVEERLILDAAAEQQRQRSAAEVARLNTDTSQQLEAIQAENQRLRSELAEAQEKLEAITSIERSIRERDGATGVP